jgi:hypothetical protein
MSAVATGLRGLRGNLRLVVGLWLLCALAATPFAVAIRSSIADSVESSLVQENLVKGFDPAWHGEYQAEAEGIEQSLRPTIAGGGALLENAEDWLTGKLFDEDPLLVGAGVSYALLWTFLLGGVLDRFARPDAKRGPGEFARACGAHFPRFVLLAALAGSLYFGVYRLAGWLMTRLESWTRDVTSEREIFVVTALTWCLIGLLLALVRVWFALARISLALAEERGALAALRLAAGRLLLSPVCTFGTYLSFGALGAVIVAIYVLVAPMAGPSSAVGVFFAFALGQAVLLVKIGLRVGMLAALTASSRLD